MSNLARNVLWTDDDITSATGGRCDAHFAATGVTIDSRTTSAGDLFIALRGPNFDGHDFVAEALSDGAVAAVADRIPIGVSGGVPVVIVDNTLKAMGEMAAYARRRSQAKIIAITGSVGKTGIKEALKSVLGEQGQVCASHGNLNNRFGLPLSIARMPACSAYGIFEMGMNHPGEIEPLSRLTRPDVALVTNVESVHSGFFTSIEGIADAKAEIFAGLKEGGTAILNRDNMYFDRLALAAHRAGAKRIIGFGADSRAEARLRQVDMEAEKSMVEAEIDGRYVSYSLASPGYHQVINSLAVLAAVQSLGGDVMSAADALCRIKPSKGRGLRQSVRISEGSFDLIDESYNASPVSVNAALGVLGQITCRSGGRRIAVLGDMLELGSSSADCHAALAKPIDDNGVDLVFAAGAGMSHLWQRLPEKVRGGYADDCESLAAMVVEAVRANDVVMVKGSAGSRSGLIVEALSALDRNGEK